MMEERHHATTKNHFYPDMFNVNKNITVEAKLINPPSYLLYYWLLVSAITAIIGPFHKNLKNVVHVVQIVN